MGQLQPFIAVPRYSHRNAWAKLHFLGQPNTFLASVNNDLQINITTSSAAAEGSATTTTTITKYKRLIRAPVPPKDVGAVQVDAATQGLRIDGKAWNGNGYFMWSGKPAPPVMQ